MEVGFVRDALRPCLTGVFDVNTVIQDVGAVLAASFAGRVLQKSAGVYYKAVWCSDIQDFKVLCCQLEMFEVQLDRIVTVSVEVGTRLE